MTIGIDASRANRDFKTGTEWYSYYLITNLIEIDRTNNYILYTDKPLNQAFLNDLNLIKNTNVKIKVLKWPFNYLWTLGRLSLEMIFSRPDVLFVPAHALPLFFPKKTVNTIHDIAFIKNNCLYNKDVSSSNFDSSKKILNFFVRFFTFGRYCLKSTDYLSWSTKFALKRAKKIIAVSHFTKKEIINNFKKVKADKIKVIHNGFNNNFYKLITDQERITAVFRKYGINFPFFLYVGRLEKKKNIHTLVEGFAIYKENNKDSLEKLVLIGSAGFGYDEMRYIIEELGIDQDVVILGWVEEEDLPVFFNEARVFIFPSFYEGFGIPVIQAMACKTPVLLSDIEVLHEVSDNLALFFDKNNPSDLAEKLREINNNSDFRQNLIDRGFAHANKFSFKKCAQETLTELTNM